MLGTLYLIPSPLAEDQVVGITSEISDLISRLRDFVVEESKVGRSIIKRIAPHLVIQDLNLQELNEHSKESELSRLLSPLLEGRDLGLLSDAGSPAVADPGTLLVRECHRRGIRVMPLVGPSSILLAVMAAGLSGQSFAFVGYPPKERSAQKKFFLDLEKLSKKTAQAQFFIETPYRTKRTFLELITTVSSETIISLAQNLTTPHEVTKTEQASWWKNSGFVVEDNPAVIGLLRH